MERDGHPMTFHSEHRPIQDYVAAMAAAGLLVDRLVEVVDADAAPGSRWARIPMFLQLRAIKPAPAAATLPPGLAGKPSSNGGHRRARPTSPGGS
jgi:hypothetical protein